MSFSEIGKMANVGEKVETERGSVGVVIRRYEYYDVKFESGEIARGCSPHNLFPPKNLTLNQRKQIRKDNIEQMRAAVANNL